MREIEKRKGGRYLGVRGRERGPKRVPPQSYFQMMPYTLSTASEEKNDALVVSRGEKYERFLLPCSKGGFTSSVYVRTAAHLFIFLLRFFGPVDSSSVWDDTATWVLALALACSTGDLRSCARKNNHQS